jgi:hypothetical protein
MRWLSLHQHVGPIFSVLLQHLVEQLAMVVAQMGTQRVPGPLPRLVEIDEMAVPATDLVLPDQEVLRIVNLVQAQLLEEYS